MVQLECGYIKFGKMPFPVAYGANGGGIYSAETATSASQ
jgi:hypothetical protein